MLNFPETSTYDALNPALAEQWRHKQTRNEIADVEAKVGDMLTQLNYESSGIPRRAPGVLRRLGLTIQNKGYVWSVRIKKFGLVDTVLEVFSRRSGIKAIGKAARARIREKQKKYLK